jgi:hypothetical protein
MLLKDTNQLDDLREFLIDWYGGYDRSYGVPEEELPDDLPKALRELYAFAGRWKDGTEDHLENSPEICHRQDCLYSVERLKRDNGRITFLEENQANWTCQAEAGNPDSPVYCDERLLWDAAAYGHVIVNGSLYPFLKSFCLQEVAFGCKHLYTIKGGMDEIRSLFDKPIEEVWLNGRYNGSEEEGPTHSFYRCGDVLVMERYGDYWLGYHSDEPAGLNPEAFASAKRTQVAP